jgi:2-polyprenyl-6-methoxyphenol hydroxylase-like FAD-dependent oxidoreductase
MSHFQKKLRDLKQQREESKKGKKLRVAILGAGPAGLIRGIQSLLEGHITFLIEKRSKESAARENALLIREENVALLKKYGIIDYLTEKKLIFPSKKSFIYVSLKNLEIALKAVIHEIGPETIIYDSQLAKIEEMPRGKVNLVIEKTNSEQIYLDSIDVIINAEGAHSRTKKELFQHQNLPVLPPVLGLAAFFKPLTNETHAFVKLFKRCTHLVNLTYYHMAFLCVFVSQGLSFRSDKRKVAATALVKTPRQIYLGSILSIQKTEKLKSLSEEKRKIFLKRWSYISLWYANYFKLQALLTKRKNIGHFAFSLPFSHVEILEAGAERAATLCLKIGNTGYLMAGDAVATVDPMTGLGCNSALRSSCHFLTFIQKLTSGEEIDSLLLEYDLGMRNEIELIHQASILIRQTYRPDTITSEQALLLHAKKAIQLS